MRAFTLPDPYRVVIDIPQVNFQLPPKTGERGRGVIKAFRYGLVMQGGSRIVIDVTGPVRVAKAFVLANGGKIEAKSAGADQGTTVSIHLPLATDAPQLEAGTDD